MKTISMNSAARNAIKKSIAGDEKATETVTPPGAAAGKYLPSTWFIPLSCVPYQSADDLIKCNSPIAFDKDGIPVSPTEKIFQKGIVIIVALFTDDTNVPWVNGKSILKDCLAGSIS